MGSIRISPVDGGPKWAIGAAYFSPALVAAAKAVPGCHFDRDTMSWHGYPDAIAAVAARLRLAGINVSDVGDLPTPDAWRTARTPFLYATTGLREYQIEGVKFLIARAREGALLADGLRLGKSAMATTAARAFGQKTLVVCPSHVVGVWGRGPKAPEGPGEIAKWWPDAWKQPHEVICLETVKPAKAAADEIARQAEKLAHAQVIICHYDILYAWEKVLLAWGVGTFISDECHVLCGYKSRRLASIYSIARAAKQRVLLSGTPVVGNPRLLHNLLNVLAENRMGFFFLPDKDGKPRASYSRVFCAARQETVGKGESQKTVWCFDGKANLDEPDGVWCLTPEETLKERMRYLMLRRLKKDVDPQLPEKQRQIIDVTIPARQAITPSRGMFGPGGVELRRALDLAADGKLKAVVDLVRGHLDEGEKCICFCYRRLFAERVANDVAKKLAPGALVEFVHGGLSRKERDERIHDVRKHDGPALLACTIDTTSTGIDLSFASVSVFAELVYESHDLAQAEERTYRFGKGTKALIQYVIARGTGDELILRGVINKLDTFERVIGSTGDGMREDLAKKKEGALKRLYEVLVKMQKGKA